MHYFIQGYHLLREHSSPLIVYRFDQSWNTSNTTKKYIKQNWQLLE